MPMSSVRAGVGAIRLKKKRENVEPFLFNGCDHPPTLFKSRVFYFGLTIRKHRLMRLKARAMKMRSLDAVTRRAPQGMTNKEKKGWLI